MHAQRGNEDVFGGIFYFGRFEIPNENIYEQYLPRVLKRLRVKSYLSIKLKATSYTLKILNLYMQNT